MSADRLRNTEAGIRLSFELPGCCHAGRVDIDATGVGCQDVWVTKLRLVKAAALGGDAFCPFIRPRSTNFNILFWGSFPSLNTELSLLWCLR